MNIQGPGAQRQAIRLQAKADALPALILSLPTRQVRRREARKADIAQQRLAAKQVIANRRKGVGQ